MRTGAVRKRRHNIGGLAIARPFAMIKCVASGSLERLHQISATVGNEDAFMCGVAFASEFTAQFSTEIKERRTFGTILGKRCIAGLCTIVPDSIAGILHKRRTRICDAGAKQPRSRNGERIVLADTTVESTVEEFFRRTELAASKFHLPGRSTFERGIILVVARIGHVNNHGIAVPEHAPARDGSALDIEFHKIGAFLIQVAHVKFGLAGNTFGLGAEGNPHSVRRNIRVEDLHVVFNFGYGQIYFVVVYIGEVPADIVAENENHFERPSKRLQRRRARKRRDYTAHHSPVGTKPNRVRDKSESKPESQAFSAGRSHHGVFVPAGNDIHFGSPVGEIAALQHAFPKGAPVRRSDVVRDYRIAKTAGPVIHPFLHVTREVAESEGIRTRTTDSMRTVFRIVRIPASVFRIPTLRRRKHPFRLRRQAVRNNLRMKRESFQIRAVSFGVVYRITVSIGRIATFELALGIRKEHCIIVSNIGERQAVAFARPEILKAGLLR